jgi:hypothetical protein
MAAVRPWDAFTATEADVRAMVANPRWHELSVPDRAHVIAAKALVTPDGDRWLLGAHARWHLYDPAGGQWHLAPPPRATRVRRVTHGAAGLPGHLVPRGPDFAAEPGSTQAFIGPDVPASLSERVRVMVREAGRRSELDYPLTAFDEIFARDVPSTVAAVWGTVMWCAYAPAFDGNERLITIFGEYLRRPLPGDEWVRWLPAPPLLDLVTIVAERVRADRSREALRLAALIADTAQILLSDARFRPRALALLTMIEPALRQPGLDDAAAMLGDEPVRQAWLDRCPERLGLAVLVETDAMAHFCHTVYELVEALSFAPDPLVAAAGFLADLSDSRGLLPGRLDHRLRGAYEELAGAGLTSTSAAETTQPEGFPVTGSFSGPETGSFVVPGPGGFAVPEPGAPEGPGGGFSGPRTGSFAVPGPGTGTGGFPGPRTGGFAGPVTGSFAVPDAGRVSTRARDEHAGPGDRAPGDRAPGGGEPEDGGSGEAVEPPDRASAAAVLGAAYAAGLAWGRATGARVPERGFAGAASLVRRLIHERDDLHS